MKIGPFEISADELGQIFKKLGFRKKIDKTDAQILFIDDEEFPVIENLQNSHWNVTRLPDVIDLDCEEIKRAHIIFVDYKGVGKYLSKDEEGFGLIKALIEKYNNKKRIILYSGHGNFTLGEHLKIAHNQMTKNSAAYEFVGMIENELKKL